MFRCLVLLWAVMNWRQISVSEVCMNRVTKILFLLGGGIVFDCVYHWSLTLDLYASCLNYGIMDIMMLEPRSWCIIWLFECDSFSFLSKKRQIFTLFRFAKWKETGQMSVQILKQLGWMLCNVMVTCWTGAFHFLGLRNTCKADPPSGCL